MDILSALIIMLFVAAVCIIFALSLAYITFRLTFYRKNGSKTIDLKSGLDKDGYREFYEISEGLIDDIVLRPKEDVYITSYDGLRLRGRYYHTGDGLPLAIECHGFKSSPMRDFSGGGVSAMEMGFNVLMIDQRAHEESEGNVLTFGAKEKYDVLSWIKYAVERFGEDVKIILHGMSMGAATVLLVSEMRLPKNVVGIVADCPYSSAEEIIKKTIKEMKLPVKLLYPFVRMGGMIFAGIDINEINPALSVKNTKVPILLIHGEGDSFVPVSMSDKIAEGFPDSKSALHKFPSAEHGISYLHDKKRYERLLREFSVSVGAIAE